MNKTKPIIIIGAGASGLMAAYELSQAGRKVIILEARGRIGGRIWPLKHNIFGYPAQGGGEFIHGPAHLTRNLMNKANLTYISNTDGNFWRSHNGMIVPDDEGSPYDVLQSKLRELKTDMPIAVFFNKYFSDKKYLILRRSVFSMVEGYDAADPLRMSTFDLRDDWLGGSHEWIQGRVKEGYGALLDFLLNASVTKGARLYLDHEVKTIKFTDSYVKVQCANGENFEAEKVIVTIPLPLICRVVFEPAVPEITAAVPKIGYGGAIKILLRFQERWWIHSGGDDLSRMNFLNAEGPIQTWWTQYPEEYPVLTGFMAGPATDKYIKTSDSEILDMAYASLADVFKLTKDRLQELSSYSEVFNWAADPFAQGAYSYPTPESNEARQTLMRSVHNRIYFAGEALSSNGMAIADAAFSSGQEVSKKILS